MDHPAGVQQIKRTRLLGGAALFLVLGLGLGLGFAGLAIWGEYVVVVPDKVYRIGADHAPPYHYIRPDGRIDGLSVEVMNAAARRRGVRLRWVAYQGQLVDKAFLEDVVDLWAAAPGTPWRDKNLYVTKRWLRNNYCLVRVRPAHPPPEDEPPARIAQRVEPRTLSLGWERFPSSAPVMYATWEQALSAACQGQADAALVEARFLDYALLDRPEPCNGKPLDVQAVPGALTDLRILAQPEAAAAAEALYLGIRDLAAEGALIRIVRKWSAFSAIDAHSIYAIELAEGRGRWLTRFLVASAAAAMLLVWLVLRARSAGRRAREAQAAAERANAAKSEFLANVSHEVRTPLAGIIGMTRLLLDECLEPAQRSDLESVRWSGEHLLAILNDILDISKVEAGKLDLLPAPCRVARVAEEVAGLLTPAAREKRLQLQLDIAPDLPEWLLLDELRLRQVLANLAANAVKFTERGTVCLTASARRAGDSWLLRFEVRDTGIGIPIEKRSRLFDKFAQADASTARRFGGAGLGLAISKLLVEKMAGSIGFSSEAGRGSTFWIELPARESQPGSACSGERKAAPLLLRPNARVLVAEDNALNRKVILRSLQNLGVAVDVAENGAEAVERWRERPYSLVLMDCQMPEMDGYDATAAIRRLENGITHTPIVALTAHAMAQDADRCRRAGMDDYLAKPVNPADLEAVVARYAGRPGPETSARS